MFNRFFRNFFPKHKPAPADHSYHHQVRVESERLIIEAGGRVCDWLPQLNETTPQKRNSIVGRALILNAMLTIHFKAPTQVVSAWIEKHGLSQHLSPKERLILKRPNDELSEQEKIDLYWYIEALWALMWVGGLVDGLAFDRPIENFMASLCPELHNDEDGSKFENKMTIRPTSEIVQMLDLYYRLHWWTRDAQLKGEDTGNVCPSFVIERRKALEWVMDAQTQWDDVELNT